MNEITQRNIAIGFGILLVLAVFIYVILPLLCNWTGNSGDGPDSSVIPITPIELGQYLVGSSKSCISCLVGAINANNDTLKQFRSVFDNEKSKYLADLAHNLGSPCNHPCQQGVSVE